MRIKLTDEEKRERQRLQYKKWYERNKLALQQEWLDPDRRVHLTSSTRKWREANKEKYRAYQRKYHIERRASDPEFRQRKNKHTSVWQRKVREQTSKSS